MGNSEAQAALPEANARPGSDNSSPPATDNVGLSSLSLEPSDDTPTVISKASPQPVSSENVLAGVLRGRKLAHFQLIEPLGVGGMAAVMLATDTQLDRIVALKILPPEMAADPENVRRFHQEARSAAKLDHENIARVFFCGEDQNLHFIAFEYVEGEDLRTLLEKNGRLPVAESIQYVLQIAAGLAHAASRGVVHRDIKPSNIIITPTGWAKLVDMGLARSLGPQQDPGLTQSGVTLGTFDYISPEQALEPRDADIRSDIYSLGCTFYHLLTGQPPVPDGTAARKLHHHQHVAPVDPRQLNPEIPDDVAALLSRMIAKNPADRYQNPEHLVQHLIMVSQRIGATPDNIRRIMYVDALLPSPPRSHPLVLLGTAIAAVVGLVILLGQIPWGGSNEPPSREQTRRPSEEQTNIAAAKDIARPISVDKGPVKTKPSDSDDITARYDEDEPTGESLRRFLMKNEGAKKLEIILADSVEIQVGKESAYDDASHGIGLVLRADNIVIRPKFKSQRPTITLTYAGWLKPTKPAWAAALTMECDTATIEGLRFRVDACGADIAMTPLLLRPSKEAVVRDCSFFQSGPLFRETGRLSSIVVEPQAEAEDKPVLKLAECCFGAYSSSQEDPRTTNPRSDSFDIPLGTKVFPKAHEAVSLAGPVNVAVSECAFGPHEKLFRCEKDTSTVQLTSCSAMALGSWTALALDRNALCQKLAISHCLFSNLQEPKDGVASSATGGAVLIRQAGNEPIPFEGNDNCYHNLDAFLMRDGLLKTVRLDDFRTETEITPAKDNSRVVIPNPWNTADPLVITMEDNLLIKVFQARTDLAELRQSDDPAQRLVGVNKCTWGSTYDKPLPAVGDYSKPAPVARKSLIVDPSGSQSGSGIYQSVNAALDEAKPGDTILIKANGPMRVTPVRLEKGPLTDLTIKPADRTYKPVLVLGDATDADVALFTLQDGKLALEGLEFLLTPRASKSTRPVESSSRETQALVRITGEGSCSLKGCAITLDDSKNASLAVVRIADTNGLMKTDKTAASAPDQMPRLRFEDCFIRGDGDLVWSAASRPFDLEASNTLVALSGSFVSLEAGRDEMTNWGGSAIPVRLANVTAYLKGYLVRLKGGKDAKGLIPVNCSSVADCLFVSASNKTLVHLEGMDISEDRIRTQIQWDGRNNLYSNFTQILDLQSAGDEMPPNNMPVPFTWDKWIKTYGENEQKQEKVAFQSPPSADALERATQSNFRLSDPTKQRFGANLAQLPNPTSN
ncbi:MAG: serine/threonine-protein kinase [Gemmataceae bacterium]